jgi:4-amino-4-deoxy-L-arabinose transferase-like glycosyltransferase
MVSSVANRTRTGALSLWLYRWRHVAVLALLIAWYGWATLPHLGDFPLVSWDEGMIAAPAYKLAAHGVYGNDLYAGYYQSEAYNYEYLPIYPLVLALTFKLFGVGVIQARMTAALFGLGALLLTYALGRQMYGAATGLLAAALLVGIRLRIAPDTSGVVLLDIARVARYEPLTLCLALATCCCLLWAESMLTTNQALADPPNITAKEAKAAKKRAPTRFQSPLRSLRLGYPALGAPLAVYWRYAATGVLAGLATLTHPNGALLLPVVVGALCWQHGLAALRRPPLYLILGGWALSLLPWLAYIAQRPADYYGQMLRQSATGRFDLTNPAFYWSNLGREPYRYADFLRGAGGLGLAARAGLWLTCVAILSANVLLWRSARRSRSFADRLLLLALPIMAGLLGLLISVKWYHYMALLLPFAAIQAAYGFVALWRWSRSRARYAQILLGALLAAALIEGGVAVAHNLQRAGATSSYTRLMDPIARVVPTGSRILIYHSYWFGLAHDQTRSILLPFYLSSPYYRPGAPTMQETLQRLSLDYLLADSHVEPEVVAPPSPGMEQFVETQQQEFMRYMRQHCADVVTRVDDPDYGKITLYRCARS